MKNSLLIAHFFGSGSGSGYFVIQYFTVITECGNRNDDGKHNTELLLNKKKFNFLI